MTHLEQLQEILRDGKIDFDVEGTMSGERFINIIVGKAPEQCVVQFGFNVGGMLFGVGVNE